MKIRSEVLNLSKKLIEIRRDLHKIPEIAYKEEKTSNYIINYMKGLGFDPQTGVGKTGVICNLKGGYQGPTIMLRADMDALPLNEKTNLPFSSIHEGFHHACGHDGHMAILLILAKIIVTYYKDKLKGNIKFVFQPAEEGGSGAKSMINDEKYPVLKNPDVDRVYGLHLFTTIKVGEIEIKEGYFSAFSDRFTVKIIGKGGHGSSPHLCIDPIYIAVQLINQFYGIIARNSNPMNPVTFSITEINSGTSKNIIPSECTFSGTIRILNLIDKSLVKNRMEKIIEGIKISYDANIEFCYIDGYPSIFNHSNETKKIIKAALSIVGEENINPPKTNLWGEDFSFYTEKIPGAFFLVGSAPDNSLNNDKSIISHHSNNFTFNEDALLVGCSVLLELIENELMK